MLHSDHCTYHLRTLTWYLAKQKLSPSQYNVPYIFLVVLHKVLAILEV